MINTMLQYAVQFINYSIAHINMSKNVRIDMITV